MKENTIALALLSALLVTPAAAQNDGAKAELARLKPNDFPTAPIEYTVVYPAGGGMDVTARLLAKYVEKWSDHRIIVNNRTGGAGMVGHAYLATQAKPDGYTVGIIANLMWGDAMLRAQGRWTYTDLEPIGYLNSDALTWVGPTEGPYKDMSVKQLVDREGQAGHAPRRHGPRQYVGLPHRTGRNEYRSESSTRAVSGRRGRHQCPGRGKRRHRTRILLRVPRPRRRRQGAAYWRGGLGAPEFPERYADDERGAGGK